mgnify:CR=1 FL=1
MHLFDTQADGTNGINQGDARMTLVATQSSGPVRLSNPISQLTATVAGAAAGGVLASTTTARLARSMFEAGGSSRIGALALTAAAGIAGAGMAGIAGARIGGDLPSPGTTAATIAAGAVGGAVLSTLSKRVTIASGAALGTIGGLLVGRIEGPEVAKPLDIVTGVDLGQYQGKWFELARIPTRFQDARTVSTAEYAARPDGAVSVHNTSYLNGKATASIDGSAVPVSATNNRLNVGFGGFLKLIPKADEGNYWVMDLADDYSMALVGSPDRQTLFLLARDKDAGSSPTAQAMLEHARQQGFDVDHMLHADWDRQQIRGS